MSSRSARDPIEEGNPAGHDLSFDAAFESISKEIGKLENVHGGLPNWKEIETSCDQLLLWRSKDLRLVVWSGVAKCMLRGFEGLADALGLYLDVVTFWDTMYPPVKRLRARANLHEWFIQQSLVPLESRDVVESDEAALHTAQATLAELDGIVDEKLGELHPGSARLRSMLLRKLEAVPQPEAVEPSIRGMQAAEPASPDEEIVIEEPSEGDEAAPFASRVARRRREPSEPPPAVRPALVYEPEDLSDATATIEASLDALLVAAKLLRDDNASDARAFQLRRTVTALRFEPTRTFAAPDASDRERFAEMFARGDIQGVIEAGEEALLLRPAWLDVHRWVALSLGRSGGMWASAHEVAISETLAMIARVPALAERRFSDDTPVADGATLVWLETERERALGARTIIGDADHAADRQLAQVAELAAQDRIMDAITLATSLANRAGDARGRFQGYLLAGTTALHAGKAAIARPLLEGLLTLVERHQLEIWEPALCVTLYASLLRCLRALARPDGEEAPREKDLFDRLCRLDPAAAMRLGASP